MKKYAVIIVLAVGFATGLLLGNSYGSGLQTWEKSGKDFISSWVGIERKIKILTKTGEVVYEFEGKFDIDTNKPGRIVFDANGSRVVNNMDFIAVEKN